MTLVQAVVLGVVQGLGEFLPISSSAHLILAPWFFHWKDPGLGFDVALHLGTLLAVLAYFRQDVWHLIKGFWHSLWPSTRDLQENIYQKLAWFIVIASVPGAIIGKLLEAKAEAAFRAPLLIAGTMAGFGVLLWLADVLGQKAKNLDRITWKDSALIGLSQALAVIPGVSRSGSTIAAGLGLKMKRADAARFSFLMSMPIILGAGLVNISHFRDGATTLELAVGFVTAAVFGFLSIKFLLRYLSNHGFGLFVWYRLALAVIITAVYFMR
ncbi:MAG: undecaprenyl-diphosphatase UppP [Patescibacteria group bacterium]|nr:undecaprenyl-diphosphatase UppP [Patescibacteria group bacterium]